MNAIPSATAMLAAVMLLVFGSPAPVFSQMKDMSMTAHRGGPGQMMGMGNMDRMGDMMGMCLAHADELGLTDDQVMKLKPMHTEMRKKHARYLADVKIAEIEFMEIMDVKDFDQDKAAAAVKKIGDIKTAHHLEMLTAMKAMHATLTDEQYKKMKKMMPMKMGEKKPGKKMMMKR